MENIKIDNSISHNNPKYTTLSYSICCLTYNMHGLAPSLEQINQLLGIHKEKNFDIYVIGFQECLRSIFKSLFYSNKSIWEKQLKDYFGNEYENIQSVTLAAIHLIILVKKTIKNNITQIKYNSVKTGVNNFLGNKGAVGIWFTLFNLNIMIINCHLDSNNKCPEKRNNNFEYIMTNMNPYIKNIDFLIFMGDLNYRLNIQSINIKNITNEYLNLLKCDQLKFEKKKLNENPFTKGFIEGDITFLPTFKYYPNQNEFDIKNKRKLPAWTDRILYLKRQTCLSISDIVQTEYNSMQNVLMSDHKPVYSYFDIKMIIGI